MEIAGIIFAILASVTWGIVYILEQKALASVPPILFLALVFLVGGILLLPVILAQRSEIQTILRSGKNTLFLILLTQALFVIANYFIFCSVKRLGAATASLFEITYPLFIALFGFWIFGSNLNIYFWIGGFFILIGSLIITKFS